jgi:hypothetical protein
MTKAHKKMAAARARAGRWANNTAYPTEQTDESDNCDYTFNTLKENMPKALESVPLTSIHQWEHQMYCWMEAYRSGLGTSAAQLQVKRFGSAKYKLHRRVPKTVGRAFD